MSEPTRPSSERLRKWLRRLRAPDEVLRVHAAMRLTTPGQDVQEALPELRAALNDADPQVRHLAAWVLEHLEAPRHAA